MLMIIYWEEVYILSRKTDTLAVASKEIGLEVNGQVSRSECRTKSQYKDG